MSTGKKTINYNGTELECITKGYWPNGIDMLCTDNNVFESDVQSVICLQSGVAFLKDGRTTSRWKHWAILPPKPAPRRLTKCEVYRLWRKGWDYKNASGRVLEPCYMDSDKDELTHQGSRLRAPNSDEWLEPTSDLLEAAG